MPSPPQSIDNQTADISRDRQVTSEPSSAAEKDQSDSTDSHPKKRVKVYPERVNRVRAKKPKTRTGCRTCKLRHVKCGEEKPHCLKCQKFGVVCGGYEKSLPSAAAVNKIKPLLPRAACELPLCILPTTALFKTEVEHQYFLYFRDEVSIDLSGPLPSTIWSLVILRASNEVLALRHLTVAIAALSKAKFCPEAAAASHRTFAIRQYGKALKEIRQIISRSDDNAVRISLLASLLIFCFENLHGDHEQAVTQVRCALNMMKKRLSTVARPYSKLRTVSSIPGLEDEVLDVFVRLDNTIMSRVATPEDPRQSVLEIQYIDEDFYMPHAFRDISEAKDYLEHVQFKAMPYLSRMPDVFMYGDQFSFVPPTGVFDEINTHMRQWATAFLPLLMDAGRRGGSDFIAAATLRVLALSTDLAVQRIFLGAAGTSKPDLFVPEALEVIDLTQRIVKDRCFKKTFVLDCGIVPSLFVAIMICKRRSIREDAISVLRSCGERMEVTWNAAAVAELGEQVLRAEDSIFIE